MATNNKNLKGSIFDKVEIYRLLNQIDSNDKMMVCVFGKSGQRKSNTLAALIDYKKNLDIDASKSISYLKAGNEINLINDIKGLLKDAINENNLPPFKTKRFLFFKNFHYRRTVNKCKKELANIITSFENQDKVQQVTKTTLPILNTISAFGISLGVPLLSLSLFRVNEIIQTLTSNFYYTLIGICVVLVCVAIFTTIYFLVSTVKNNKKTLLVSNISDSLEKFVSKWFVLNEEFHKINSRKNKASKIKFSIKNKHNFFYNEINYKDNNYETIIKLMKVILMLKNNVFFTLTFDNEQDFKLIKKNHIDNFLMTFDISKYKNRGNNNALILILLNCLMSVTGINTKRLFQTNQLFANSIRFFLNNSSSNLEYLNFLNNIMKYCNMDKALCSNDRVIEYFVNYLPIIIFYTLEKEVCLNFLYELGTYFSFNIDSSLFNNLKIANTLVSNLEKFDVNALVYNSTYLLDDNFFYEITNSINDSKKTTIFCEDVETNIIKRGFTKDDHFSSDLFNGLFINQYYEKLFLKKMPENLDESLFNLVSTIKQKCKEENAQFFCLVFGCKAIFFQSNLDSFEIIEDFFN